MNINTKIKKLTAVFLVVVGILLFYVLSSKRKVPETITVINPPGIPVISKAKIEVASDITKSQYNFPKSLPFINQKIEPTLDEDQIENIGKNFGFDEKPLTFTGIVYGKTYSWTNERYSLQVSPSKRLIQINSSVYESILIENTINKQLSAKDIETLAENFLIQKIGLNKSDFKTSSLTFLKDEGNDTLSKASQEDYDVYQVNFSPSISDIPIYSLNPEKTIFSVRLLKDGSVLDAIINLPGSLSKGPTEYPILSYEDFQKNINKAILISLTDININISNLSAESFGDFTINSIDLAYLLDKESSENLQPVFILNGTGSIKGFGDKVAAIFYLPAFSGNY